MTVPVIAIVEDDDPTREMLSALLAEQGYATLTYAQGKDAHHHIRRARPDLILLDQWLEDRAASGMVLGLLELDPVTRDIPVIVMSADVPTLEKRAAQLKERGHRTLAKPFDPQLLSGLIGEVLRSERRGSSTRRGQS